MSNTTQNRRIGLTGGIASGKSTVARMLREAGIPVLDADQVARDVVAPGEPALEEIFQTFGEHLRQSDGQLDRKALGQHIFQHKDARETLNAIVHPRVAQRAEETIQRLHQEGHQTVIYEVPLLFENNLQQLMDATILVAIPEALQKQRLMARDSLDEAAAQARINAQMPLEQKRALADHIVDNTGQLAELKAQVDALLLLVINPSSPSDGHLHNDKPTS